MRYMGYDFQEQADRVHEANTKWWHDLHTGEKLDLNLGERLMLAISELSEAMEGARKNLMDDHLPSYPMFQVEIADCLIRMLDMTVGYRWGLDNTRIMQVINEPEIPTENVGEQLFLVSSLIIALYSMDLEDEGLDRRLMASVVIGMLFSLAIHHHFNLWSVYEAKMRYNATRHDHTREGRLEAHGKRW